jgi:hypothetical protein
VSQDVAEQVEQDEEDLILALPPPIPKEETSFPISVLLHFSQET